MASAPVRKVTWVKNNEEIKYVSRLTLININW